MSSSTRAVPDLAGAGVDRASMPVTGAKTHRRTVIVTAGIAITAIALLVDLVLAGHTVGEEIWGPITAAITAVVALLSLTYLAVRGRSRLARGLLYALWVLVAFLGFGGYNDHRLPRPADTITDQRERPPLAPLAFTGLGILGAAMLRNGSKGE